ncbi:MAG TPA: enoyl-CoA hydratase-related protein [Baekduia sp.]|uniref:enoyl-CoA hydratase/isomerase family protein n=1 Tax=Baekduia sp. TaxID=2600305 RepID=UPI002D79B4A9|nr:enoyl-CoA hydratase-related protein [Baekduia sp.]HET6507932.1 enoyl-CoA hydratase-related protein [Baekduia sp.]
MAATAADFETMLVDEAAPGVLLVTLNRPDRLNAQTNAMFSELERLGLDLRDRHDVRALILTGAGRGFCAGFDLDAADELPHLGAMGMLRQQELAARAMQAIRGAPMPVIAAVNGPAAGGGLALALAADIRLAAPEAKFNAAFVKIGLSAGDLGTSWIVPRLIGPGRAAEFVYTGRIVDAEEAERTGLVNRVVPADELLDAALDLAGQIAANSPGGVQLSKTALQAGLEMSSYAALQELENRGQALLTRGSDMPEALAAFKEKRPPRFTGR